MVIRCQPKRDTTSAPAEGGISFRVPFIFFCTALVMRWVKICCAIEADNQARYLKILAGLLRWAAWYAVSRLDAGLAAHLRNDSGFYVEVNQSAQKTSFIRKLKMGFSSVRSGAF
jgi:hypothetical protein